MTSICSRMACQPPILVAICCLLMFTSATLVSGQPATTDSWADWRLLIGSWETESEAADGSTATLSLIPDLQRNVLVCRSHTLIPSAKGRKKSEQDDLMVIYRDQSGATKSHYYDSKGEHRSYDITISATRDTIIFIGEIDSLAPRFKMTYAKAPGEKIKISYAVAPSRQPDDFSTYLERTVRRKAPDRK